MVEFIQSLFSGSFDFTIFIKAGISALIALYFIFTIVVATQVRSLNRIVKIQGTFGSLFLQFLTILYCLLTASLFLATWYIL